MALSPKAPSLAVSLVAPAPAALGLVSLVPSLTFTLRTTPGALILTGLVPTVLINGPMETDPAFLVLAAKAHSAMGTHEGTFGIPAPPRIYSYTVQVSFSISAPARIYEVIA